MTRTRKTPPVPAKKTLKAELLATLEATLATLEAAHADTREAATHEEAKPENDKDTRALEQSYLARGQAMRIEALKAGLAAAGTMSLAPTDVAREGALVEAEDEEGEVLRYYLAPEGGGTRLGGGVQVVTPASPLGAALVGRRAGDEVELKLAGRSRTLSISAVS
ncbi:MAG: GreA/GreB family elongation factor [Myxococcota bacterium]